MTLHYDPKCSLGFEQCNRVEWSHSKREGIKNYMHLFELCALFSPFFWIYIYIWSLVLRKWLMVSKVRQKLWPPLSCLEHICCVSEHNTCVGLFYSIFIQLKHTLHVFLNVVIFVISSTKSSSAPLFNSMHRVTETVFHTKELCLSKRKV